MRLFLHILFHDYLQSMNLNNSYRVPNISETGAASSEAAKLRVGRYTNARTQMTSSFPPQKRLTLERKSPVTRLDINAPSFDAYKKTYPGLYKTADEALAESK